MYTVRAAGLDEWLVGTVGEIAEEASTEERSAQ